MNKQLQNKLKAYSALSAGATLSAFAAMFLKYIYPKDLI